MTFFSPLEIPRLDTLRAEIFGVDEHSYFHIDVIELGLRNLYMVMLNKMELAVRDQPCLPRHLARTPGTECIIKYYGRRGGSYVRGTILEPIPESEYVFCNLIDDFMEAVVHVTKIFPTNADVLKFPKFALKCKLVEMDCFIGDQTVQTLYREYMNSFTWKLGYNRCTVQVLQRNSLAPTVRLTACDGKDLTNILQQLIPVTLSLKYPAVGVTLNAEILSCEDDGVLWYRPAAKTNEGGLSRVIKKRLDSCLIRPPPIPTGIHFQSQGESWKSYYFSGPGQIFIYTTPCRKHCYRVRLSGEANSFRQLKIKVHFIDYGYSQMVSEDNLQAAHLVDPTLCFIPPQCLPVKFLGSSCLGGHERKFETKKFWKYAGGNSVSILIKQFCRGSNGQILALPPIVDVLISNPLPYGVPGHPGHSLGEIVHLKECGGRDHPVSSPAPSCGADAQMSNEEEKKVQEGNVAEASESANRAEEDIL